NKEEDKGPQVPVSGQFFPISATTQQLLEWMNKQIATRKMQGGIGVPSLFFFLVAWARDHESELKNFVREQFADLTRDPILLAVESLRAIESEPLKGDFPCFAPDGMEILVHAEQLIRILRIKEIEPHHVFA